MQQQRSLRGGSPHTAVPHSIPIPHPYFPLILHLQLLPTIPTRFPLFPPVPAPSHPRTVEVLDQFERSEEQQQFIVSIFETIDSRSQTSPEAFNEVSLTALSDVCQNGVQTLSSVSGDGMELVEKAMTTLMQSYITEQVAAALHHA